MRFVIAVERVESSWSVSVSAHGDPAPLRAPHPMAKVRIELLDGAQDIPAPADAAPDVDELTARISRLRKRSPDDDDARVVGAHLFDALLGGACWEAILETAGSDAFVELALTWPATDGDLHRMHWEMMHDGESFLAERIRPRVAITRVVPSDASCDEITHVPRVLFAIGSKMEDMQIRPGLELMGIMRRAAVDHVMTTSLLVEATPQSLAARIERFRPDVVHLISHGTADHLKLRSEAGEVELGGSGLLTALTSGDGRRPGIVILSACDTATPAALHSPSLAACLVAGGIPVVIGMGGKISDRACRLFSRRFGQEVLAGQPLVRALSAGRRAALTAGQGYAANQLDWALPTVHLAESVPVGFRPVSVAGVTEIVERIKRFKDLMRDPPVFFARQEFLDDYADFSSGTNFNAIGIVAEEQIAGLGERRLIDELTERALRDGHIPVRIVPGHEQPRTALQLAARIVEAALATVGNFHGREVPYDSHMLREWLGHVDRVPLSPDAPWTKITKTIVELAHDTEKREAWIAEWLGDLVREELYRLRETLHEHGLVGADSRVVVFLADVHYWHDAAKALFGWLRKAHGLGRAGQPVLTVFSVVKASGISQHVQTLLDDGKNGAIKTHTLAELKDEERFLAYQWVLLHPRKRFGDKSNRTYVAIDPSDGAWKKYYRDQKQFSGRPGDVDEELFYTIAELTSNTGGQGDWFKRDDDEAAFHAYRQLVATED